MFDSKGQIRRLFQQGAIKLNGERKENCEERLNELSPSEEIVIKAGKSVYAFFGLATILLRKGAVLHFWFESASGIVPR